VLVLAGSAALSYSLPIGFAIAILIAIVVSSYRQTILATLRAAALTSSPRTTSAPTRRWWRAPRC